jgi:hypothetical protein
MLRLRAARMSLLLLVLVIPGSFGATFADSLHAKNRNKKRDPVVVHTYGTGFAAEVANTIPVSAAKLAPLLPDGYELAPAAALGLGGSDQGLVVIFNFYGLNNTIDRKTSRKKSSTRIDLLILVQKPAAAGEIGADIPAAYHFYSLAFFTNDTDFAASLKSADMPVEFVPRISFERDIDDAGQGAITVSVPSRNSPFLSFTEAFGHAPAAPLNGVFWYEGKKGTAALHFQIDEPEQGQALSLIYTEPESPLNVLLTDGGLGPGPTDPETGYPSVLTPSLNLWYPHGSRGRLWLIPRPK